MKERIIELLAVLLADQENKEVNQKWKMQTSSMTPFEVVSEVAGWAGMFIILFMLSVIF